MDDVKINFMLRSSLLLLTLIVLLTINQSCVQNKYALNKQEVIYKEKNSYRADQVVIKYDVNAIRENRSDGVYTVFRNQPLSGYFVDSAIKIARELITFMNHKKNYKYIDVNFLCKEKYVQYNNPLDLKASQHPNTYLNTNFNESTDYSYESYLQSESFIRSKTPSGYIVRVPLDNLYAAKIYKTFGVPF